ncbi:transmembrane protein, putative (macronuclear) [Tetrahymena thermophila SB210]|uniref:Transmembrane protein, putative n=1 Tax=Tetrahymena thermophila (strain SB210) TaxID=312017 RepID=W7XF12_TETTS|nr:transmembrane protein, putative [Tetrahymena thermophila SB210]EWS75363.1 transmembrane protein, putative [Tetrahymena thermophila SB210]|eukprot:XP_012652037.1 transmembrane protein, putative [Tetrahymena thermophila SB210]
MNYKNSILTQNLNHLIQIRQLTNKESQVILKQFDLKDFLICKKLIKESKINIFIIVKLYNSKKIELVNFRFYFIKIHIMYFAFCCSSITNISLFQLILISFLMIYLSQREYNQNQPHNSVQNNNNFNIFQQKKSKQKKKLKYKGKMNKQSYFQKNQQKKYLFKAENGKNKNQVKSKIYFCQVLLQQINLISSQQMKQINQFLKIDSNFKQFYINSLTISVSEIKKIYFLVNVNYEVLR